MFEECFKKYNWTNNHGVILGMCDNQSSDSIHLKGFYPNPRRPAEFMSMQIMLKWSLMYVLWFFFFFFLEREVSWDLSSLYQYLEKFSLFFFLMYHCLEWLLYFPQLPYVSLFCSVVLSYWY